jgi:hypothetical protein
MCSLYWYVVKCQVGVFDIVGNSGGKWDIVLGYNLKDSPKEVWQGIDRLYKVWYNSVESLDRNVEEGQNGKALGIQAGKTGTI